jgi:hypothetical protein
VLEQALQLVQVKALDQALDQALALAQKPAL